jgi:diguanylate cyclase
MIRQKHPSEIAREVFKQLALRKLLPTPINYQECYNEIANLPNVAGFPEARLRQIALALTARNPAQQEQLDLLDAAIGRHSWQGVEDALVFYDKLGPSTFPNGQAGAPSVFDGDDVATAATTFVRELLERVAQLIHNMKPALEQDDASFSEQLQDVLKTLRDPAAELPDVHTQLVHFSHRLSFAAEEQSEIKHALLKLLHLIIENISKLTLVDSWLDGQIDALLAAIRPPLSLRHLDDVEKRIRDVMHKQAAAKERSLEAQEEMRQMLSAFIEHLSEMNTSSAVFQTRIEASAQQIEKVKTIEELAPILKEVIGATRAMAEVTSNARDQLNSLQAKALATEAEIAKLHLELHSASALARHDPLTNTLNRKGLDEALAREIANVRRKGKPLSIALLDIDNFKKLNDRLGHEAGDAALIHLVRIVRESLRPADSLARYGGEEFVILLPDTPLDEAISAMTRLQRELTKNFFLSGNEKILITFSAGVAQLSPEESGVEAINRADQAMYLAKRAGKNRVMGG